MSGAVVPQREVSRVMFWYGGGWGFWWVALMWIVMIGFWGLLIWGVWAVARALARRESGPGGQGGAGGDGRSVRGILDERLARGEIDIEEYQRLRDTISGGNGTDTGRR